MTTRSERVKSVDTHDSEPWFLASLYNGQVVIYNYETNNIVKTIEAVENIPVRSPAGSPLPVNSSSITLHVVLHERPNIDLMLAWGSVRARVTNVSAGCDAVY